MAYNPINTKQAPVNATSPSAGQTAGNVGIAAPDAVRNQIFSQAGIPEFYGVSLMEILELGVGKRFNTIFSTVSSGVSFADNYSILANSGNARAIQATEQIVVGLDRSRDALVRAVAVDSDTGSEFTLTADDQYTLRQNKIGYFGALEEGRMVLDNRALVGLIV